MGLTFYITRRKMKAALEGLVYRVCQLFPINQKKVVMWTFEGGGGYGCSPKYVAEEILKRNREGRTEYTIYWIIKDTEKARRDKKGEGYALESSVPSIDSRDMGGKYPNLLWNKEKEETEIYPDMACNNMH